LTLVFAVDSVEALCGILAYYVDLSKPFAKPGVDGALGMWIRFKLRGLPDDVRQRVNAALDRLLNETLAAMPARGAA
jgi:hypothetical protein